MNSFDTLDHFKVDCQAEELTEGHHLVILIMGSSLKKDSQTSSVLGVYYERLTSSTSETRLLLPWGDPLTYGMGVLM